MNHSENLWAIFRFDAQITEEPANVDIYMILDTAQNLLLAHQITLTELSQEDVKQLIDQAKEKAKPNKLVITKGDPAEALVSQVAKQMAIPFEAVSAQFINDLTHVAMEGLGQAMGGVRSTMHSLKGDEYASHDQEEIEAAKLAIPDSYDPCPCASGKKYKFCCKSILNEITNAMCLAEEGNFPEAFRFIEQAKNKVGETPEVICREAIICSFFDEKKYLERLLACLKVNPKHPRAHYLLGLTAAHKGLYDDAIEHYTNAIDFYPPTDHFHLNEAYNNLGVVYKEMGSHDLAREAWQKALLYAPHDSYTKRNLESLGE